MMFFCGGPGLSWFENVSREILQTMQPGDRNLINFREKLMKTNRKDPNHRQPFGYSAFSANNVIFQSIFDEGSSKSTVFKFISRRAT
jgi:hypothetical protein